MLKSSTEFQGCIDKTFIKIVKVIILFLKLVVSNLGFVTVTREGYA